jgi:hypothetical protein
VPEFEIAITADLIEHTESTSNSTTDFTMVNTTGVEFSGQLEEINPENLEYILSGTNHEIASTTVTDQNLGTVVAGDEIMLNGYNLSAVSFKGFHVWYTCYRCYR